MNEFTRQAIKDRVASVELTALFKPDGDSVAIYKRNTSGVFKLIDIFTDPDKAIHWLDNRRSLETPAADFIGGGNLAGTHRSRVGQ